MAAIILQWNLNGLFPRLPLLQVLLNKYQPDIVCLQETNLKPNQTINLKRYKAFVTNRNSQTASGGTAVLIKNSLISEKIHINSNIEITAVKVRLPPDLFICSIYLPNSRELNEIDLNHLINNLPKPFIILGDFNSHNSLWSSNKTDVRGIILEKVILNHNIIILNDTNPTHFSIANGSFSTIDLALCSANIAHKCECNTLTDLYDSDHFPIITKINLNRATSHNTFFPRWKIDLANWNDYRRILKQYLQPSEDSITKYTHQIDHLIDEFISMLKQAADQSIPKTVHTKRNNIYKVPWWNNDCNTAIKDAKRAFNKFKKHKTLENLIAYKKYRAVARTTIRQNKKQSWINFLTSLNSSTPSKIVWNKIKAIQGSLRYSDTINLTRYDNSIITDNQETANVLAEAFVKNSSNSNYDKKFLTHRIEQINSITKSNQIENKNGELIIINDPFKIDELINSINELKKSSPGPDGIPNILIIKLPLKGIEYLLKIFNLIWNTGAYPKSWSESIIIPILKPGKDSSSPESYRPISLTNTLCKLVEKLINHRLRWILESNNIISPNQSGFRPLHSTMDQLINIESFICDSFINKQHTTLISIDIEKAYDMVCRKRILTILKGLGLQGNILIFIQNFLKTRIIRVKANGTLSEPKSIQNGVPQGSILSVTLFLLAINEIISIVPPPAKTYLFADDLTILYKGKTETITQKFLQEVLIKLQEWSIKSGFTFSKIKTKFITFCRQHKPPKINLHLGNLNLEEVSSIKILGIIFDNKLTWKTHIDKLKNECITRVNILKILSANNWGADKQILLNTYKSLIRSRINYGSIIYQSASKTVLQKLDPIHNTDLRIISGAFRTSPIFSILKETGEPNLNFRRKLLSVYQAIKISTLPNKPSYSNTFSTCNINKYSQHQNIPKPFHFKIHQY